MTHHILATARTELLQNASSHLGPIISVRDVVEVPAGGHDGMKTCCRHVLGLILPVSLPHINDSVGEHLSNSNTQHIP